MEKHRYHEPSMEILILENTDIVCNSGNDNDFDISSGSDEF